MHHQPERVARALQLLASMTGFPVLQLYNVALSQVAAFLLLY